MRIVKIESDNGHDVEVEETSLTQLAESVATMSDLARHERAIRIEAEANANKWRKDAWALEDAADAYRGRWRKALLSAAIAWLIVLAMVVAGRLS